eukprot:113588_1
MGACTSKNEEAKPISRRHYTVINWTEQANIGCDLFTPPILRDNNDIIFLSTDDYKTQYTIYNLNTSQFTTKLKEIDCSNNETFDIKNTVYTYNQNNKQIYFIENNKNLLSLDLSNESNIEIKDLNHSIITTNDNYAVIYYMNNKVYIIGDETSLQSNKEFVTIPYSSAKKQSGIYDSRLITVLRDGITCIYILGGIKHIFSQSYPTNGLWTLDISNNRHQWGRDVNAIDNDSDQVMDYYTPYSHHSFGTINYKNKYIILLGGEEQIRTIGFIWFLSLFDNHKYGLEKNHWYELHYKLPLKGYYHAVYTDNSNMEIIHLFSYDGRYYTIQMNDILSAIKQKRYNELSLWTQAGKTVLPTKSSSGDDFGPKDNNEVDDMLDALGKEYEPYKNKFKDIFSTYDEILNNKNKLEQLVANVDHKSAIFAKAQ